MQLLKNKRAWKAWAKENGFTNQEPTVAEPLEYPCFAYTSCRSFGYEELNEHYLYHSSLSRMQSEIEALWPVVK